MRFRGGPDRTRVEVWADPTVTRNTHTVIVKSDSSDLTMTIENLPSEENPRTGRMPALDRYRYVVRYANDTRFGLRGSSLVASNGGLLALEADRPYRAEWLLRGKDPNAGTIPASGRPLMAMIAQASRQPTP